LERLTFSGRWFTIAFVILLTVGVVFGAAAAIRFQKMLLALETLRSAWPNAATVLEKRYQEVDALLSKEAAPSSSLSHLAPRWAAARTEFKKSNLYDSQAKWVADLESTRNECLKLNAGTSNKPTDEDAQNLAVFINADKAYEALQSDRLGKVCKSLFRLQVPERIHDLLKD
jgi:hypothetical protein